MIQQPFGYDEYNKAMEELFEVAYKIQSMYDAGEHLDEGILGGLLGGTIGLVLGPKIGKVIAKILGIQKGPLYNLLTSKMVSTAIGAVLASGSNEE